MQEDRKSGMDEGAEPEGRPPGSAGNSLEDASDEAVREIEKRGDEGHAGAGDIG